MISLCAIYQIEDSIIENTLDCGTIFWTAEQFAALEGTPSVKNFGNGTKVSMSRYRNQANRWVSGAPKLAAKEMADTQYYILGYVIQADGTVSYSSVMPYTVEQYISNMVDNEEISEFVMRLYYYERAAKNALG